MPAIEYTAYDIAQKGELEAYLREHGINEKIYLSTLDGKAADPAIFKDPAFKAYWQLTYLNLMEIILRPDSRGGAGEVQDIEELIADPDFNKADRFVRKVIADSPELMAFAVREGISVEKGDQVLAALNRYLKEGGDEFKFVNEKARALKEDLGLEGEMYDVLLDSQEGTRSAENHLFITLAEMDEALLEIENAFKKGEIDERVFQTRTQSHFASRQLVVSMIQQLEDAFNNLMEMFSNLENTRADLALTLARQMEVA